MQLCKCIMQPSWSRDCCLTRPAWTAAPFCVGRLGMKERGWGGGGMGSEEKALFNSNISYFWNILFLLHFLNLRLQQNATFRCMPHSFYDKSYTDWQTLNRVISVPQARSKKASGWFDNNGERGRLHPCWKKARGGDADPVGMAPASSWPLWR